MKLDRRPRLDRNRRLFVCRLPGAEGLLRGSHLRSRFRTQQCVATPFYEVRADEVCGLAAIRVLARTQSTRATGTVLWEAFRVNEVVARRAERPAWELGAAMAIA